MLFELTRKPTFLTETQQEVLAAIFAFDAKGQRNFQEERLAKIEWKKATTELEHVGLIKMARTGEWEVTPLGEDFLEDLPAEIWSNV